MVLTIVCPSTKGFTRNGACHRQMVPDIVIQGLEALAALKSSRPSFEDSSTRSQNTLTCDPPTVAKLVVCHGQVVPDIVTQALEALVALKTKCPSIEGPSLPVAELRQHAQPVEQAQMTRHAARLAQVAHGVRELHGYALFSLFLVKLMLQKLAFALWE